MPVSRRAAISSPASPKPWRSDDARPKPAAAPSSWAPAEPTPRTTYYCNATPTLCRTPIPSYHRLTRANLYPNIDWVLYANGDHLEYDLVLHPGAFLGAVRLAIDGAPASLDAAGRLHAGLYRHDLPLIIDPVIESATVLGGAEDDIAIGAFAHQPPTSTVSILYRYGVTSSAD